MVELAPFVPVGPADAALVAPEKQKRRAGTRKAKAVKIPRVPKILKAVEVTPVPVKKPRKPRAVAKAKPAGKLGINEIVSATVGLKEDEAKTLLKIVGMLADHKKSSKPKILSALGKLFA
jgi:hypothetical protein